MKREEENRKEVTSTGGERPRLIHAPINQNVRRSLALRRVRHSGINFKLKLNPVIHARNAKESAEARGQAVPWPVLFPRIPVLLEPKRAIAAIRSDLSRRKSIF
jgi:hypothetical protein